MSGLQENGHSLNLLQRSRQVLGPNLNLSESSAIRRMRHWP